MTATAKNSRKLVFTKAWGYFKTYNMTFSQALIEAWKLYKKQVIKIKFSLVDASNKVLRAKLSYEFEALSPVHYPQRVYIKTTCENKGAQFWYDGKTYNGD